MAKQASFMLAGMDSQATYRKLKVFELGSQQGKCQWIDWKYKYKRI